MKTIKEELKKIEWDKRENPNDYSILYIDRILNKLIEIPYKSIKRIEGTFFIIHKDNEEIYIPLHRIRKLKKDRKIIWERRVNE